MKIGTAPGNYCSIHGQTHDDGDFNDEQSNCVHTRHEYITGN